MNAFTILGFLVIIPAYHFGVVERFGKRTGRILYEGLSMKWPFIDQVELVSLKPEPLSITVGFITEDNLKLICSGSLQYRPDSTIADAEGRNVFVTMSDEDKDEEKMITIGLTDAVKSKLGALGGVKDSKDFRRNRQAISDLINCTFRLGKSPHLNHDSSSCGVSGCAFAREIDAEYLLDFYKSHWRMVKPILDGEKQNQIDYSPIERRYGIDIELFALANIDFSPETEKAFEKEKQAEARAKAFNTKLKMAKKAKKMGASAQEALNAADVSLDPSVKKEIVSVEGEAGVIGGLLGKINPPAGGKGGK